MTGIRPSLIAASRRRVSFDPDAADYFARIVSAGSSISAANKTAVDAFVKGCKTDGIWSAIKACCLLAGPDDLTGALVPLVGAAPTNVGGNFVSADYNRTTGLKGDGSTKYLNSNRNNNTDDRDNQHMSLWVTEAHGSVTRGYMGVGAATSGSSAIITQTSGALGYRSRNSAVISAAAGTSSSTGFIGLSRSVSTEYISRNDGANDTRTQGSQNPLNADIAIFGRSTTAQSTARLSFYSIGESLDLALLDARISTYMASIT
jgi:hypothetical protein